MNTANAPFDITDLNDDEMTLLLDLGSGQVCVDIPAGARFSVACDIVKFCTGELSVRMIEHLHGACKHPAYVNAARAVREGADDGRILAAQEADESRWG